MRREQFAMLVGLASVVVIGVAVIVSTDPGASPRAAAQNEKRERWEYAALSYMYYEGRAPGVTTLSWEGPDGTRHKSEQYLKLAEKMNLKIKSDDSTAFLNALSDEGWELATHAMTHGLTEFNGALIDWQRQVWTLKRRK